MPDCCLAIENKDNYLSELFQHKQQRSRAKSKNKEFICLFEEGKDNREKLQVYDVMIFKHFFSSNDGISSYSYVACFHDAAMTTHFNLYKNIVELR